MAHLSRLKAFWHSCDLRLSDVERESYERAFEAVPPTTVATLADPAIRVLIAEVIAHRNNFLLAQPRDDGKTLSRKHSGGSGDMARFWLRKTQKPVLCVLLVQREGGPVHMHRGINLEVSMPTGSLCAERNVIGTAYATDPSLRREDLRMIAVLAVEPTSDFLATSPSKGRNPLSPCGACMEWLRKIYEVNPSFRVLTFEDESCQKVFVKTVGRS
jgi:cytidine deaminase